MRGKLTTLTVSAPFVIDLSRGSYLLYVLLISLSFHTQEKIFVILPAATANPISTDDWGGGVLKSVSVLF